jgi:hypothetical protein
MDRACPVNCIASDFTPWGKCSVTCGKPGKQERHRTLIQARLYNGTACPKMIDVQECYEGPCAVDCTVTAWDPWSTCTRSCGVGFQSRSRSVDRKNLDGGAVCPHLQDRRTCHAHGCPVDCVTGAWGAWSPTIHSTEKNVMLQRSRDVLIASQAGGADCGGTTETKERTCADQKVVGEWSNCTEACGTGYQYRYAEHVSCATTAALRYHMRFRQGRRCYLRACTTAELAEKEAAEARLTAPPAPLPPATTALSQAMTLDEEVVDWERAAWRAVKPVERQKYGLPAGHWQVAERQ